MEWIEGMPVLIALLALPVLVAGTGGLLLAANGLAFVAGTLLAAVRKRFGEVRR